MTNKVLIKLYVPSLDCYYDIFIPVNELVWKTKTLIVKSISDLSEGVFATNKKYALINTETGNIYNSNDVIINTDIKNSTNLALVEVNKETSPSVNPLQ